MRTGERGFTYMALLILIAVSGAFAAAAARRWQTAVEREREAEQLFRARQIALALARYRDAQPGLPQSPRTLEELLDDRRSGASVRHLRRLYVDPATGRPDWELVTDERGGIVALRSRSMRPAWRIADLGPAPPQGWRLRDRVFELPAAASAPRP